MSLSKKYLEQKRLSLVEGMPVSMWPLLEQWLEFVAKGIDSPVFLLKRLKNKFDIDIAIFEQRFGAGWSETEANERRFIMFLKELSESDSEKFFIVIDYLISNEVSGKKLSEYLEKILLDANHRYSVAFSPKAPFLHERLSSSNKDLLETTMAGEELYSDEFANAVEMVFSSEEDGSNAASAAFKSLESALKFYLGEQHDQSNLGSIKNWLNKNRDQITYKNLPKGVTQEIAKKQFIEGIDFINKCGRSVKHGQREEAIRVDKKLAITMVYKVAALIAELSNNIEVTKKDARTT